MLPSSSSVDLTLVIAGQRGKTDHIGEHCVLKGQMSMAFKNKDQKFASRRCGSIFSNETLLSCSSIESRQTKDLFLSIDDEILNREHGKSDSNFVNFMQQDNDVVIQQPFPEGLSGRKYSTRTFDDELTNGMQHRRKADYSKCCVQMIRGTVVLKGPVHNASTLLDRFCVTSPKYSSSHKKQQIPQIDDRHVPASCKYCVVL